eukprot:UN08769
MGLEKGNIVFIDNTNSNRDVRKPYIHLAHSLGIQCHCVVLNSSLSSPSSNNVTNNNNNNNNNNNIIINSNN